MKYLLLACILLIGCTATKEVQTPNYTYVLKGKEVKAFNKSEKAYNFNAQGSRVFSIYKFPITTDTFVKQTFIKGDTITILGDTIKLDCTDTLYKDKIIYRKCPDSKLIVDTVIREVQINVYDTKEVDAISHEANECKDNLIKEQRKTGILTIWIIVLAVLLIISLLFNFKR